jgi:two-component system, cell cycle sensor histidine kinase and response regulator CckA
MPSPDARLPVRTLLLVDDEPAVRAVAGRILRAAGYSVHEAGDGVQAWITFQREPSRYDALVTDVVMPRMPGTQLATQIRSARPSLPVLLMSAYSPEDLLARGLEAHHGELLSKPFGAEQLLAAVGRILASNA